ncbi:MAG: hypothetical protein HY562_10815 [Ignavibacteriales bacterium]|nr:hypothetical protein [Ignavibacteriales bacterium]
MRSSTIPFIAVSLIVLEMNCVTKESITRRSQLHDPLERGPITVLTNDTTLYELNAYRVDDSVLTCSGSRVKNGIQEKFSGSIDFRKIVLIQSRKTGIVQYVGAGIAIGAFALTAATSLGSPMGLTVTPTEAVHGPGGGSSCPFIYSWNGERYVLEAEAFGAALAQSLEYESSSVLRQIQERQSEVRVRITNERPETHYFNSVRMLAVEHDPRATLYVDGENNLWPVYEITSPLEARDKKGSSILHAIGAMDSQYWESDFPHTDASADFEDELEIMFSKPKGVERGTLVIDAANTRISDIVIEHIMRYLGDKYLEFLYALEHDAELQGLYKQWIEESALKISVAGKGTWESYGSIPPEANEASFSKAVRISVPSEDTTVQIRLRALNDVWKLDAIRVDWTPVRPVYGKELSLMSGMTSNGSDAAELLEQPDQKYLMLLPPEYVDLNYRAAQPARGKKISYVLYAKGFLYEWMRGIAENSHAARSLVDPLRIPHLKKLLQNKNLFLPSIYAEWAEEKQRGK